MSWIRALVCFVRGHEKKESGIIEAQGAHVEWCPTCRRVRWVD